MADERFSLLFKAGDSKSLNESKSSIDSAAKRAATGKTQPAIYDTVKLTVLRFFGE